MTAVASPSGWDGLQGLMSTETCPFHAWVWGFKCTAGARARVHTGEHTAALPSHVVPPAIPACRAQSFAEGEARA